MSLMSPHADPASKLQVSCSQKCGCPFVVPRQLHGQMHSEGRLDRSREVVTCRSRWPVGERCSLPCHPAQYLVQVIGTRVHPLAQNIPLLPPEQAPERGQATDLQAVQPAGHVPSGPGLGTRPPHPFPAQEPACGTQEPGLHWVTCRGRGHTPTWRRRHRSSRCGR